MSLCYADDGVQPNIHACWPAPEGSCYPPPPQLQLEITSSVPYSSGFDVCLFSTILVEHSSHVCLTGIVSIIVFQLYFKCRSKCLEQLLVALQEPVFHKLPVDWKRLRRCITPLIRCDHILSNTAATSLIHTPNYNLLMYSAWTNDIFTWLIWMSRCCSASTNMMQYLHCRSNSFIYFFLIALHRWETGNFLSIMYSLLNQFSFPCRPEITLKRYAGCLREIEVSRTPYNLLSSSDYTGVTKGCNVEVREST